MSGFVDMRSTLRAAMALAALALVLVLPVEAGAATDCAAAESDPTAAQYCTTPEVQVEGEQGESSTPPPAEEPAESEVQGESAESVAGTSGGTLPFTGEDLLALAAVAAALVAIGLALQRLSKGRIDPH